MKHLPTLLLSLLFMVSCVKESSTDFRDKYLGNYKGTYTWSVPELPGYNSSRTITATVVKGSDACQLLINNVGVKYYAIAYLDNNKYVYSTFEIATNTSGVTTAVRYTG